MMIARQSPSSAGGVTPRRGLMPASAREGPTMATDVQRTDDAAAACITFGPFRLFPRQRLLTTADKPVHIGSRAFDILVALLERPGDLITKQELIARVWPNTFVEQANLAVQIAGLRRALDDGHGRNRYVINIPGRGYRFVAPVTVGRVSLELAAASPPRLAGLPSASMPRSAESAPEPPPKSQQRRVLTIVRPHGASQAEAAIALLEKLLGAQDEGVWLLDVTPFANS